MFDLFTSNQTLSRPHHYFAVFEFYPFFHKNPSILIYLFEALLLLIENIVPRLLPNPHKLIYFVLIFNSFFLFNSTLSSHFVILCYLMLVDFHLLFTIIIIIFDFLNSFLLNFEIMYTSFTDSYGSSIAVRLINSNFKL